MTNVPDALRAAKSLRPILAAQALVNGEVPIEEDRETGTHSGGLLRH